MRGGIDISWEVAVVENYCTLARDSRTRTKTDLYNRCNVMPSQQSIRNPMLECTGTSWPWIDVGYENDHSAFNMNYLILSTPYNSICQASATTMYYRGTALQQH